MHDTTTTLASAPDPSAAGGPVTYAATIRPAPGDDTVAFTDLAAPLAGCGAQSVDSAGTATCQIAYLGAGGHRIVEHAQDPSPEVILTAIMGHAWVIVGAEPTFCGPCGTGAVVHRPPQMFCPVTSS